MTSLVVRGPAAISGSLHVPGDKSISHRALMLGAMATGRTTLRDIGTGADLVSTIACLLAYGVAVEQNEVSVTIDSRGIAKWTQPEGVLECGNSGTTMRVLAGLAAQSPLTSVLDGDASLRRRPMDRVARPLQMLGARVMTTEGCPPITVEGGDLKAADITIDVASAQVKTAVIFAALGAEGVTAVTEPLPTRDHTERMLGALGAKVTEHRVGNGHRVEVERFDVPPFDLKVPGDLSSAAFPVAAAVLCGDVRLDGVGLNSSRLGFLDVLASMGADVSYESYEERMNEPIGSIEANRSDLRGVTLPVEDVPRFHDELPLLAVIATQAEGETVVRGAEELRVKESDRIDATVKGLRRLGADIDELPDGFVVRGPTVLTGTTVDAVDDHRIAMAFAVAGLVAKGDTVINGFEAVDISWPGFTDALRSLGAEVEVR